MTAPSSKPGDGGRDAEAAREATVMVLLPVRVRKEYMKVGFVPYFEANPVQKIWKEKLEEDVEEVSNVGTNPNLFSRDSLLVGGYLSDTDVLHVHWKHPLFLANGSKTKTALKFLSVSIQLLVLKLLSVDVVWTIYNKHNHEKDFLLLDYYFGVLLGKLADQIQVWDENWKDWAIERYGIDERKVNVIPHGNYEPVYDTSVDEAAREEVRRNLDIPESARVLLFFGLIRPYKQVPELVETFKAVNDDEDTYLLIAGNPVSDDLEERIREETEGEPNIRTKLGFVPEEEVPKLFQASDVVVLPYEYVHHSGVVLLAMSMGKPFAAPATSGWITSVSPEGNVLYDDLAEGLRTAIDAPDEELEAAGRRNVRKAEADHDWNSIVDDTVKMYRAARR